MLTHVTGGIDDESERRLLGSEPEKAEGDLRIFRLVSQRTYSTISCSKKILNTQTSGISKRVTNI